MTRAEFEARLAAAQARLADEWEHAWRERRFVKSRVGADFAAGVPGDLIVETIERQRVERRLD